MKKYQYKVIEVKEKGFFVAKFSLADLEDQLNGQGEVGWELVSSYSMDLDNNGKKEVVLIFKKEVLA